MYSSRLSRLGVVCLGWAAHLQLFYHSDSERCARRNSLGNLYARCFCRRFYFKKLFVFFFYKTDDNPLRMPRVASRCPTIILPKTPAPSSTAIHRPKTYPGDAVSTGIAAAVVRAMVFTDVSMCTENNLGVTSGTHQFAGNIGGPRGRLWWRGGVM